MMRVVSFLLALALVVSANKECHVHHSAIGADGDAGPAINAAFQNCSRHGKVILDGFYTVNTLLFTTNLTGVEVQLSGTSARCRSSRFLLLMTL